MTFLEWIADSLECDIKDAAMIQMILNDIGAECNNPINWSNVNLNASFKIITLDEFLENKPIKTVKDFKDFLRTKYSDVDEFVFSDSEEPFMDLLKRQLFILSDYNCDYWFNDDTNNIVIYERTAQGDIIFWGEE